MSPYYFMPDEIRKSVYDIDLHLLYSKGFRCILVDLDNTLMPWNDVSISDEVKRWFARAERIGFKAVIVSNNDSKRIEPIAKAAGVPFLPHAGKPMKKAAIKAMEIAGASRKQTVLIGDQLLTDIWTGKRARIYTVLVSPINTAEFKWTRFTRLFERAILSSMGVKRP